MNQNRASILNALALLRIVVGRDRTNDARIDDAIAELEAVLSRLDDEALKA